jgi:hypothetical protein
MPKVQVQEVVPIIDGRKPCRGVIEIIIKDRNGVVLERRSINNLIKIFAKEMLSHRLPSSEIWDPLGGSGTGAWIASGIDPTEEFSARYILFGAAFDSNGIPIDNDPRYYTIDTVTGAVVPIKLEPGAYYDGELINSIPISDPGRPLKKVESITFQPTYQPAGVPLLQADVRAINNVVVLETELRLDEYNGMGVTNSDFFTITEVALAGGKKFDNVGACELKPRDLFLEGKTSGGGLACIANGSDVISIDPSESQVDLIKQGDQIKITESGGSTSDILDQISPFYLVIQKSIGGRDIMLDRTPVTSHNIPITGSISVYRDTLRIFSHVILSTPFKKSNMFQISLSWSIVMN